MPVTSLRKACVRPPEVAKIKSKIKIKIKSKSKKHAMRPVAHAKKTRVLGGGIRVKTIRSKTKVRGP